jgi:hypothetical protein
MHLIRDAEMKGVTMKRGKLLLVVMVVLMVSFIAFATMAYAKEKETEVAGKEMEKPMEMFKYKNIMGEFGAEYHFLADIGEMIDKGREHRDGNTLLAAALLLFYAEKDAGKKAETITGKGLLEETANLAKEQNNEELASKIADFYEDDIFGMDNAEMANEFRKLAKQYKAASETRAGYGTVIINNDTPYYIRVYVNGYDRGILYSGNIGWVTDIPAGTILLYGYAPYTDYEWGPITGYLGSDGTYTWNLIFND